MSGAKKVYDGPSGSGSAVRSVMLRLAVRGIILKRFFIISFKNGIFIEGNDLHYTSLYPT